MNKDAIVITQEGLDRLKAELHELITVKRVEVTEAIKRARELGDLSENSLYDQSRSQQSFIEGRIEELEAVIEKAQIIQQPTNNDVVSLGSKVVVHIDGDDETLTLVGEPEADPSNAKISHTSPLGQALIGKKVGEVVEVDAPVGTIAYTIKQVA